MAGKSGMRAFLEDVRPYIAMICLQFGYAGMAIITKVSLNKGMSHYVLVVYRHAFATAVIAPFALLLERKMRPKMTFPIFMQIFVLGLLGPVIDQNFFYAGLKLTSPTFACALSNILPAMTFVIAVLCKMEKVNIKKVRCQAKVVGTFVTVGGAMLMTLYKGNVINPVWSNRNNQHKQTSSYASASYDRDWVIGSVLLILATLAWASFFVFQAFTLRKYTAQLSLTALVCFIGTLQSIAVTFVMERKSSVWHIGWDINLLAAAYAGIVSSGIAYYVQGVVMQKRGPVFVTAFNPLIMVIVAFMGSLILAEQIYLGGVVGAALIVIGLYAVLWGKYKETEAKEGIEETEKSNNAEKSSEKMMVTIEEGEENDVEMQKKVPPAAIAISSNISQPPMLAKAAPKSQN